MNQLIAKAILTLGLFCLSVYCDLHGLKYSSIVYFLLAVFVLVSK